MAVQNYTTFTETDPNSRYTVTSTKIDVAGLDRSEDAHVYRDYGSAVFSADFTHKVTVYIDSASQTSGRFSTWVLTNAVNDINGLRGAAENYLELYLNDADTVATINIAEYYGTNAVDASISLTFNTPYYLTITRNEAIGTYGTLYCYIYDDSDRTNLVDTLTLTLRAKLDFRYLFGANSFNNSTTGYAFTGYVENLDIDLNTTSSHSADGGGIGGGSASLTSSVTHTSSGGGIGGGTATQLTASSFEASGGGVAGGNADYLFDGGGYYTMQGGAIAGGSADITTSFSHIATGGGIVGGTAPYSFTITAVTMEILWRLVDPSTEALLTGESANTKVKVRRTPDGYVYDWNDATFKASGWTTIAPTMSEVDATNLPGLYKKEVNIAAFVDGWYQVYADYTGTFNDYSDAEFLISSGNLVDIKTSTNLDAQVSTVNTNVLARLAAADYTAPDNAGIAANGTAIATMQGDVTTALTHLIAMSKWKNNKLARTVAGTTETWVLYDDDSTTPLLTWTNNISTRVRTKAT